MEIGGGVFGRVRAAEDGQGAGGFGVSGQGQGHFPQGQQGGDADEVGLFGGQSCGEGAGIFFEGAVEDGNSVALGAHITGEVEKA